MVDPSIQSWSEILQVCLGGSIGALVKDALKDGCLELPYVKDGKLFLGFIGGALIGAFIGMVIDGNFITAAMGGYTGSSILTHLVVGGTNKVRSLEDNKTSPSLNGYQVIKSKAK